MHNARCTMHNGDVEGKNSENGAGGGDGRERRDELPDTGLRRNSKRDCVLYRRNKTGRPDRALLRELKPLRRNK